MWSPLTPRWRPRCGETPGRLPFWRERIRIGGVPIAPAARISTLHSISSIGDKARFVAGSSGAAADEPAVRPRRGRRDLVHLDERADLDPGPLGGGEVVGDHRVLAGEHAARVAPLRVDATLEVDRQRHPVAGVARLAQRRGPDPARLRDLLPGGLAHPQGRLGAGVVGVERRRGRSRPATCGGVGVSAGCTVACARRSRAGRGATRPDRGSSRRRRGSRRRSARPGPGSARRRRRGARRPSTAGSRCDPCACRARARRPRRRAVRRGRARRAARRRSTRRSPSRRCRRPPARPLRGGIRASCGPRLSRRR